MGKFLFLLLLVVIGILFFKTAQSGKKRSESSTAKPPSPERMVQCAHCGTFMPESDSVQIDGAASCRDPAHCGHAKSS